MGDTLEEGLKLNKDKPVIWEEEPNRSIRDGLSHSVRILYGVFVLGSLIKEYKNSEHLHGDKSNLHRAWAGEIFRGGIDLAGIAIVYYMFYQFYH